MKFSTRSEYGLRAMVVLAGIEDATPVSLRQIASLEQISEQYLEQIFMDLKKAELVQSIRGAYGGYLFARDASEISIRQILEVLEGPIFHCECLGKDGEQPSCSFKEEPCIVQVVWRRLQDGMDHILEGMNLRDLQQGKYL